MDINDKAWHVKMYKESRQWINHYEKQLKYHTNQLARIASEKLDTGADNA